MSINDFVIDSLSRDARYKKNRIWTIENHEKYSTLSERDLNQRKINEEVFHLMCALNQQGVEDDTLCACPSGQGSLKTVLQDMSDRLSVLCHDAKVHYVELGPEPIKTSRILSEISATASHVDYTAIDINESSRSCMQMAVSPLVSPNGSFNYLAADYRTVESWKLDQGQDMTIITMLGFQEGNELPVTTGRLIRSLSGGPTYVISEMQLFDDGLEESIYAFYSNPNMVRFSELIAYQQGFEPLGQHEIKIVRMPMQDELLHVAITLQPVRNDKYEGYLLTNICLKYSADQFRRIRSLHGRCEVIEEFVSGDRSVMYQVAKYGH